MYIYSVYCCSQCLFWPLQASIEWTQLFFLRRISAVFLLFCLQRLIHGDVWFLSHEAVKQRRHSSVIRRTGALRVRQLLSGLIFSTCSLTPSDVVSVIWVQSDKQITVGFCICGAGPWLCMQLRLCIIMSLWRHRPTRACWNLKRCSCLCCSLCVVFDSVTGCFVQVLSG